MALVAFNHAMMERSSEVFLASWLFRVLGCSVQIMMCVWTPSRIPAVALRAGGVSLRTAAPLATVADGAERCGFVGSGAVPSARALDQQ